MMPEFHFSLLCDYYFWSSTKLMRWRFIETLSTYVLVAKYFSLTFFVSSVCDFYGFCYLLIISNIAIKNLHSILVLSKLILLRKGEETLLSMGTPRRRRKAITLHWATLIALSGNHVFGQFVVVHEYFTYYNSWPLTRILWRELWKASNGLFRKLPKIATLFSCLCSCSQKNTPTNFRLGKEQLP